MIIAAMLLLTVGCGGGERGLAGLFSLGEILWKVQLIPFI